MVLGGRDGGGEESTTKVTKHTKGGEVDAGAWVWEWRKVVGDRW